MSTDQLTPKVDVEAPVDLKRVNKALTERIAALETQKDAAERALHSYLERFGRHPAWRNSDGAWRPVELVEKRTDAQGTRIPIQRADHDVLVSLAQLGEEQLAALRHILAALPGQSANDERSSFEIDSNGSAGSVKCKAKEYGATVAEARAAAEYAFVKQMAVLEVAKNAGWAATLEALDAERAQREVAA